MPDINITVRDKIAKAEGSPEIVCGNSDYAAAFDLDSEWDTYDLKTMRVVWIDIMTGIPRYIDVPFSGNSAVIPAVYNAYEIAVGIYAGDIRTTTPARIPCERCITDGSVVHETPSASVYEQIIDLLEKMAHPVGFGRVGDSTPIIDGYNLAMVGQPIIYYDNPTLVLTITKTRSTQTYGQIAELLFYDSEQNQITPAIEEITANVSATSSSEGADKCLDGNINTKWCWHWQNPTALMIKLSSDFRPAYFLYVTANDSPERDAVSFTIEYKYHADTTTMLDVHDAEITSSRKAETQKFALNYAEVE